MNNDTTGNGRAFVENYAQICYDQSEVKNRNVSGSQNLVSSGEDESGVNNVDGDIRHGPGMEVLARDDLKIQLQQTPGSLVNWERFLPVKSVKVLLVESDDSTRHVVSALLRNCSYEVTAVAHGLQAWKTLQDVSSRIDLVLTEVVTPLLSGMDLLCKIMRHKTLKNIPVIMMSSHDSMGIVFKCLSKGAVDFLAKPIRKNELKNLWQHVWRRSYSLSGSGSESGTQAEQSANFRVANDFESNTSNSEDHGNGLSIQKCSGNVSGTETSWTKKAAEIKHVSPLDQMPKSDALDITCAEVMYVGPEKHYKMDEQQGTVAMGKDVISENLSPCKDMKIEDALSEVDCKPKKKGHQDQERGTCGKLRSEGFNAGDGDGAVNCSIPQPQSKDCNGVGTKRNLDQGVVQYLELTLKRLHGMSDDGKAAKDDHNTLRHSDLSAFSKYSTVSSVNQGPSGNKGSSPLYNGSDVKRSCGVLSAQQSNGSTKNNQLVLKSSESSAFQPVQNEYQKSSSKETELPSKASHQKVQVQHHHHHHHHHHYHHHQQSPDLNENISEPAAAAAASVPPHRSSNLAMEENAGNISGGGSNQGSDGNRSNSTPSGGDDTENGTTKTCGSGCGFSVIAVEEDRVAMREAALTKFRQKRKERCFDKRVRYQSRKKLAEQRPRMKGQFVKQIKSEAKSGEEGQSKGMKDSCDTDR